MPAKPTHRGYIPAWQPAWYPEHMECIYYLVDPDQTKLIAMARELAPLGFRVKTLCQILSATIHAIGLVKDLPLSEADYATEIDQVLTLCDRYGIDALDELRVQVRTVVDVRLN